MPNEDADQGTTDVRDGDDLAGLETDLTDTSIDRAATDLDLVDAGAEITDTTVDGAATHLDPVDAGAEIAVSHGDSPTDEPTGKQRPRIDKGLLAACFVIAGGLMLIGWGLLTAQTGDDGIDRPDVIENLSPVENALQVLQQETIVVDLDFGYEAELILDGIELEITRIGELDFDGLEPGEQVATPPTAVFDPGNSRIEFRPTEGAQIEELTEGRHTATVIYWRLDEGRENARSYTWSFDVI